MTKSELLKKFIENRCTAAEAAEAMEYLHADPNLLNELLGKSEWDEIDDAVALPAATEYQMQKKVVVRTMHEKFGVLKPALLSAAILSAVIFGITFLIQSKKKETVVHEYSKVNLRIPTRQKITNNTSVTKHLRLPDNSTVDLFPGSSVEFRTAFNDERTITLNGKAMFSVTKNAKRPFTVYSGAVTTTALGTRFLVDNCDDVDKINVKLFEGKVVVKAVDKSSHIRRTFLYPGQQCFVDAQADVVHVHSLYTSETAIARRRSTRKINIGAETSLKVLSFSKVPLTKVLDLLQARFSRKIDYGRNDVKGKYFTGSFPATDSLSAILQVIADINDIRIKYEGNGIRLSIADKGQRRSFLPALNRIALIQETNTADNRPDISKVVPAPAQLTFDDVDGMRDKVVINEIERRYNRIPFTELLHQLQKESKKKIYFNADELGKINFTGSIPLHESLRNTLSLICEINGLTLTVKKGAFYITALN